ncbi:hypothetical protein AMECASPLE_039436 [Ameca splendens]|uniref:Uncharacterized protein n=1 Tax=Ameca splendens TaxID=208324 RepID=A0ABV0Y928_9TELE
MTHAGLLLFGSTSGLKTFRPRITDSIFSLSSLPACKKPRKNQTCCLRTTVTSRSDRTHALQCCVVTLCGGGCQIFIRRRPRSCVGEGDSSTHGDVNVLVITHSDGSMFYFLLEVSEQPAGNGVGIQGLGSFAFQIRVILWSNGKNWYRVGSFTN